VARCSVSRLITRYCRGGEAICSDAAQAIIALMRIIGSALRVVLELFVDDGVYAAVTIAWITAVVAFGSRGPDSRAREGLLLALGLDLIFALSVILRVRSTIRSRSGR
jgi:hypothetical protein